MRGLAVSSDIDFDELDKAVSSLMGNVTPERVDEAPKQKTLSISSTLKPGENPAYARLDEVAKSIGNETLVTDGERTVDVDDVAPPVVALEAVQPAVQPVDSVAAQNPAAAPTPQPTQAATTMPQPVAEIIPETVPAPIPAPTVPRPATGRFMDVVHPSSVMRSNVESLDAALPVRPVSDAQANPSVSVQPPSDTPLTPFIPDAKVEKRPLGGIGAIPSPFDDDTSTDAKDAIETPTTNVATSINAELSDANKQNDDQPVLDASAFEQASPAESPEINAIESTEAVPESASQPETIAVVESGDTEHLKESHAAPNKEGTIYDVANQTQPLAHPAKQKSGWGVVILIVVIIIVAAALGAAAYFILGLGV